MGVALVGTSGYSYKDWIGPFYPQEIGKSDFVSYYSHEFPVVELNFSYYRQPDAHMIERLVEKTPQHFTFSLKAHRSITHEVTREYPEDIAQFKEGIRPLLEHSKLGAVLFQFPYSFHYTSETRKYLYEVCTSFEGLPRAVEFRNREWQQARVTDQLRSLGICLVSVDEPNLPNLLRPSDAVTADFAYVRFHGRNKTNWWGGDNTTRYDYLYSENELAEWLPRIQKFIEQCSVLYIFFNNHSRGKAVVNARMLSSMVEQTGSDERIQKN